MTGKIAIHGHIGDSYVDPQGQMHKGTNLLNVIEQVESFPQATELEISINSPGGYVDVGDSIYDYLVSQKKLGKRLTTIQSGLVGSIATKLFLAGDRRIADDRYEFWIHNPFVENVSGDQDEMRSKADQLAETEKNLRKFYAEFTSISDEGLDGLMKIETGLTADQCVKFGFATEKKLIPAFNAIKKQKLTNKMSNTKVDEKSFIEHVMAYFNKEKAKGVQPKAAIPGQETKSLMVQVADNGGAFWIEGEAIVVGAPAFTVDENGQQTTEPVQDGSYMLDDGTTVDIAGGLVSAVTPAEADSVDNQPLTAEKVAEMVNEAVSAAITKANETASAEIAKVKKESEDKILALKSTLKLGIQPKKGYMAGENAPKLEYKSIAQRMAEKAEERQKQLNKN